jgi:hypothetical protein
MDREAILSRIRELDRGIHWDELAGIVEDAFYCAEREGWRLARARFGRNTRNEAPPPGLCSTHARPPCRELN